MLFCQRCGKQLSKNPGFIAGYFRLYEVNATSQNRSLELCKDCFDDFLKFMKKETKNETRNMLALRTREESDADNRRRTSPMALQKM